MYIIQKTVMDIDIDRWIESIYLSFKNNNNNNNNNNNKTNTSLDAACHLPGGATPGGSCLPLPRSNDGPRCAVPMLEIKIFR